MIRQEFLNNKRGRKNILLIPPTIFSRNRKVTKQDLDHNWWSPHYGLIRLVSFLNANGHNAECYDTILAMLKREDNLEGKLREKKWDIIGFSLLDPTLLIDISNIYLASKMCSEALLIAGGEEAQFNYQTILDKTPCKIVVLGEGEKPLLMLANDVSKDKIPGIVFRNNAVPLSQEEFVKVTKCIKWEIIPYEEYWDYFVKKFGEDISDNLWDAIHTVRIFTKNRCLFKCNFCSQINQLPHASGRNTVPYVSLSNDDLIEVIKRIKKSHERVKTIYFTDDSFCSNRVNVIDFCKRIVEEDLGLKFMCQARITDLTEEVILWMKRANFIQINIGIESFSENVLKEINKKCDREIISKNLALLKQYKLNVGMFMILITPKSTLEDIEETVDKTLELLKSDFFSAGVTLSCLAFKGSQFYEDYCDFLTINQKIEGTKYSLKKDLIILAEDPIVRKVQLRHFYEVEKVWDEAFQDTKMLRSNFNLSMVSLNFLKQLIKEAREKHGLHSPMLKKE